MTTRRFMRSNNRMIAGVCAGIAEYFGWSTSATRFGYVLLSILSVAFPGIIVYVVLWLVIPERTSAD
ncbi:MAG TPA: PspC domain-containing protein [Candidatus Saccharimonadia bacterium]|nr:PspC domain-containing protein [Candidatus Saccharimonadia bacterium]